MGIEEEQVVQVKGVENTLNKVIVGNFMNLEKEMGIYEQEAFRQSNRKD
jgi:hypothetical protein